MTFLPRLCLLFLMALPASGAQTTDIEAAFDRIFSRKDQSSRLRSEKVAIRPIQVPLGAHRLTSDLLGHHSQWLADRFFEDISQRHGSEAWLPEARLFINESAPFFNRLVRMDPMTGYLAKPSKELRKTASQLGPLDPLLLFLQANLEFLAENKKSESLGNFSAELPTLLEDDNHPALKLLAITWLWGKTSEQPDPEAAQKIFQDSVSKVPSLLLANLAEAKTDKDAEAVYLTLHHNQGMAFLEFHARDMIPVLERAESPVWLRETLVGELEADIAWQGRGNGWAGEVTEQGWKEFGKHLKLAREHLVRAWQANPEVPWAASWMIAVTMAGYGEQGSDERVWFDRAITAVFDFEDAYNRLTWAYRPRWGGSHQQMLSFGAACAATGRYDTRVPSRLFKIIKDVASEIPDRNAVHQDAEICRQIVKLQEAMLENAATESEKHYYRSFLVTNAFLARDYATASESYAMLKQPIQRDANDRLNDFGQPEFLWKGVLEIYDVPAAFATLQKAENAYRTFQLPTAQKLYQELEKSPSLSGRKFMLELVRIRLAAIAVEQRLSKGGWVQLAPDEHKVLWQPEIGHWEAKDDGRLMLCAHAEGTFARVILNARIGREYEVRARLCNIAKLHHPQFGAVLGYFWGCGNFPSAVCGQTSSSPASTGAALVDYTYVVRSAGQLFTANLKHDSTIRFKVAQDTLNLWVDERKVLDDINITSVFRMPNLWTQVDSRRSMFGFGANHFPKGESLIQDIEFRRLDVKP